MAMEVTAAAGMRRATLKTCFPPRLSGNVFLAGEERFVACLHRPVARMVAAVAGHTILTADNADVTIYEKNALLKLNHRNGSSHSPTFSADSSMDQTGMPRMMNHEFT